MRFALSLSPQPKKRKYVCLLPRHTCHVCHAALAVHHDCPPPSPHGRGGLLVAGGLPRTGCRGTRASGRLRPRKPLPPLLVRTVSSFCTTPVQPNRPLVEPARTVVVRKFRCALFLLPIYLLWSAPQAQQVHCPSPAPCSRWPAGKPTWATHLSSMIQPHTDGTTRFHPVSIHKPSH